MLKPYNEKEGSFKGSSSFRTLVLKSVTLLHIEVP